MTAPNKVCPPVVTATEGQRIASVANAVAPYSGTGAGGKPALNQRILRVRTQGERLGHPSYRIAYRATTGQIWAFEGRREQVLEMLATRLQGLTQLDCYPWHTRLAATVETLRKARLSIYTVREGPLRNGRYFLRTPGCLIIQANNSVGPAKKHRVTP